MASVQKRKRPPVQVVVCPSIPAPSRVRMYVSMTLPMYAMGRGLVCPASTSLLLAPPWSLPPPPSPVCRSIELFTHRPPTIHKQQQQRPGGANGKRPGGGGQGDGVGSGPGGGERAAEREEFKRMWKSVMDLGACCASICLLRLGCGGGGVLVKSVQASFFYA
jgi:hypothetical protein